MAFSKPSRLFIIAIVSLASIVFFGCGLGRLPPVSGTDAELNRCLHLSGKKKYQQAIECLEVFKSRYPGGEQSANADLLIADNYYRQKEYLLAAETYQEVIRHYSYHPKLDYAYYKSGLAYFENTPKAIDRAQENLDLAVKNFEAVTRYFPDSPYAKLAAERYHVARAKLAKQVFYVARFYYKYSEYLASIPRLAEVINDYAQSGYDEKSYYYLVNSLVKTDQVPQAKNVLKAFEERYPQSTLLRRAMEKIKSS